MIDEATDPILDELSLGSETVGRPVSSRAPTLAVEDGPAWQYDP